MLTAKIRITLRSSILDPQGKAVEGSLKTMGFEKVVDTRIGKYIELKIDSKDKKEAESIAEMACKKLLANPVMENYDFEIINSED
jgi:phosphoribosylformylglycinamidine synthase subunit PurS